MKGFLYWAISFRFIPNFVIFSNQFAINFHSKPHASKGVYRYHFMTYSTVIQTKTYSFHVSALRKFIYDKTTAKKRGSLSESVFLDVERTYAVHFLLATCNVRPMTTPEFFPQKPVSNHPISLFAFLKSCRLFFFQKTFYLLLTFFSVFPSYCSLFQTEGQNVFQSSTVEFEK